MAIVDHHCTDEAGGLGQVRRKIANWQNYRLPSGLWAASDPDVETQDSPPADWTGGYDFTHACLRNPLQAFVGDSTDPANTALIGLRLAARPECWVNFKAIGVNAANMVIDRPNRRVGWPRLWAQTDLGYDLGRGRVNKIIRLRAAGHPVQFRFAIRLPAGCTHEIVNNALVLKDSAGVPFMHSPPAWGQDANEKLIGVKLLAGQPITFNGVTYPTIRLVPNATDLATATYPVILDPTTTISGTTYIEDGNMNSVGVDYTYGGNTSLTRNSANRGLTRLKSTAIPAGGFTGFRFYSYCSVALAGSTLTAYMISDANTWVEGNSVNGLGIPGTHCWSYCKYNTQAWAGSAGCSTAGTDYDTDASPPTMAISTGVTGWYTFTLKPSWLSLWKSGGRVDNGFVMRTPGGSHTFITTEGASNQPYFEIDYTPVTVFTPSYRRRRI